MRFLDRPQIMVDPKARAEWLKTFNDDGHRAHLVVASDSLTLDLVCPYVSGQTKAPDLDPTGAMWSWCTEHDCLVDQWYRDIREEALEVGHGNLAGQWHRWVPSTVVQRLLWRFEGYGQDAEFWFTLDDLVEPAERQYGVRWNNGYVTLTSTLAEAQTISQTASGTFTEIVSRVCPPWEIYQSEPDPLKQDS